MNETKAQRGPDGPTEWLLQRVFEAAQPYLQTRENDLHIRICYRYALRLLESEPGDPALALPAVLLHDVGWSQVPEEDLLSAFGPHATRPELTRHHEVEGARIASEILRSLGYPAATVAAVAAIVDGHDTRHSSASPEESVAKDADKLFRFSRHGFFIDTERFGRRPEEYLSWLEEQVDRWFFTETARRIAREEAAGRWEDLRLQGVESPAAQA